LTFVFGQFNNSPSSSKKVTNMAQIHQLIKTHGVDTAKQMASAADRKLIDLAAAMIATENPGLSLCYSGFALTALPHRALPAGEVWERRGHNMRLIISPGSLPDNHGVTKRHTVPYGPTARMILLYLQTQALKTDNPEITLGNTMREWLNRMGLGIGGRTAKVVRDQARLISICHLQFVFQAANSVQSIINDAIVRKAILIPDNDHPNLWEDTVRLSDTFFQALKDHPVPLAEPAIREISNDSSAIDVYIWLAYRLHSLTEPTPITWNALHGQFGAGYKLVRQFKVRFIETLTKALAVYPDALVSLDESGVILYPSRPPVAARMLLG
jgi:hypothetical protein